jgi:hypothetical protein
MSGAVASARAAICDQPGIAARPLEQIAYDELVLAHFEREVVGASGD